MVPGVGGLQDPFILPSLRAATPCRATPLLMAIFSVMIGQVQAASSYSLVVFPPSSLTLIFLPVGLQVEAPQYANSPLHSVKPVLPIALEARLA